MLYKRGVLKNFSKFTDKHSSHPEVLWQNMFLKISLNSQKNTFAGISYLIKLQAGKLKLLEAGTGDVQ